CAGGCYRRGCGRGRIGGGGGEDEYFCCRPPVRGAGVGVVGVGHFFTPRSCGPRAAPHGPGAGGAPAGRGPGAVMAGAADQDEQTPQGRVITLRAPVLPLSGGYRLLLSRRRVSHLLEALQPDRLEVSDRTTLRWTGQWARSHSVPTVMISHESVTGLL